MERQYFTYYQNRVYLNRLFIFSKSDLLIVRNLNSMRVKFALIVFAILTNIPNQAQSDLKKWSEPQGEHNWMNAKAKCSTIKMRLPTRLEIEDAYNTKLAESWRKDWYWTSEESNTGYAYIFSRNLGLIFDSFKENSFPVRCIR